MQAKAVRRSLPSSPSSPPTITSEEGEEGDDKKVEMVALADLKAHLPTATALILCLPGTAETEGASMRMYVCAWYDTSPLIFNYTLDGRREAHPLAALHSYNPITPHASPPPQINQQASSPPRR